MSLHSTDPSALSGMKLIEGQVRCILKENLPSGELLSRSSANWLKLIYAFTIIYLNHFILAVVSLLSFIIHRRVIIFIIIDPCCVIFLF